MHSFLHTDQGVYCVWLFENMEVHTYVVRSVVVSTFTSVCMPVMLCMSFSSDGGYVSPAMAEGVHVTLGFYPWSQSP